ncbi:demethoxyubiquinone hydroxylase family protein [Candidatus Tisiphia endosymbiont of Thecophora atra]|uniref:demethoxyubiquinone hydroxylase family protein n=1 Tax=Candidatus Tisiphia endosymbiont of Thecophora atra TaxID=3066258 RepID=UPI00312CC064
MARPDFTNSDNIIKEIIRVNHAGEYGAKRIYQGQLNYCKNHEASSIIKHMMQQEEVHLSYFTNLLLQRNVRPTIFIPFWHIIGYILGSGSILIGTKTAMLLTQSVEEVIEQHYQKQIDYLELYNLEKELVDSIKQFQAEEIEHKDIALVQGSSKIVFASLINTVIKLMCNMAINVSKKA